MRHAGRITGWKDGKGFGFVTPHDGGARAFVHIKAFEAAPRRPIDGDLVSYATSVDSKGRLNAIDVRFAGQRLQQKPRARASARRTPAARIPRLAIGLMFLLIATALMMMDVMPETLWLLYLLLSIASYLAYALDKEVAGNARWRRMPEKVLHVLDLLGGWPGGLIAQQVTRHKTAKTSFQIGFWFTVALNLVLLFAWLWHSGVAAGLTGFVAG